MHGSYHQPDGAVSDNACDQLLQDCRNTLLYGRHADALYRLWKSEHPSTVLCGLCSHPDTALHPVLKCLCISRGTLQSLLCLHSRLQVPVYPGYHARLHPGK